MAGYWAEPRREHWVELGGQRFLCTGDRARRDAEGCLHFLGRVDRMIKIRGYRVEPEEVERALNAQTGVTGAVVVPAGDVLDRPTLAALVRVEAPETVDEEALRRGLARLLPGYAIPELFVITGELPRTGRGKVDVAQAREIAREHLDARRPRRSTDPGSAR